MLFWKWFQSKILYPERNQPLPWPEEQKAIPWTAEQGVVNCSNPKEWRWEKGYRLVDLQEICAQPMVCDIKELPLERIMIFKLSSHLVILMVTTIIFILGILHWATNLKVWLSLCEEWMIHLPLAVCNTGKTLLYACSYSSWQRICI